jgi:molybdate transport system substrate-binding protein
MITLFKRKWLIFMPVFCVFYFSQARSLWAEEILIFAASSLTLPLQKIINIYQRNTLNRVRISFAASSTLARQISQGAPADIFISANQKWIDFLTKQNSVIAQSKRKILSNNLVIISPINHGRVIKHLNITSIKNMLKGGRLGIGDPDHVPLGIYSKQALTHLNLWQPMKNRLARLTNARAVLTFVEWGETSAGIVYQSDAHLNKKVSVIYKLPHTSHNRITYWAAISRKANHDASRQFFDILFNQNSKFVFKHHGFLVN